MNFLLLNAPLRRSHAGGNSLCLMLLTWMVVAVWLVAVPTKAGARPVANAANAPMAVASGPGSHFVVTNYEVHGNSLLLTNELAGLFIPFTGTNVTMDTVVKAAAALHYEFCKIGYSMMSVAIAPDRMTNGTVTLNAFRTTVPQVVVAGKCCLRFTNSPSATPATPAEIVRARQSLKQTMAELKARQAAIQAEQADTRVHVVSTNAGPRFAVKHYLITGNTVLPPATMARVLTNIDGAFGTNVSFAGVRTVVSQLQKAYRERGYVTVAVALPQQKLKHATVKVKVTEGRLAVIDVTGNRYVSSNNVMRALPSLHTNMLLNGPIFQAELNRANANRDRQIYPVIGPGPAPGTSALMLKVKDQLPLHGKIEFNNQNSPGTPEERVNASAVYENLWQRENSLGIQYSFSPEGYKAGNQWNFYDLPLVANYSAFYRLPLGTPRALSDVIANNPRSFGYDEATHRFNLPPPSGQAELNLYASRSTIDTGVQLLSNGFVGQSTQGNTNTIVTQQKTQQGITINQNVGFQLNQPLPQMGKLNSSLSGGLDYKTYSQANYQTNTFSFNQTYSVGGVTHTVVSQVPEATPATRQKMDYLPLSLNYHGSLRDALGMANMSLGVSANLWYSSSISTNQATEYSGQQSLQNITGSSQSSGHWVVLRPRVSQELTLHSNWVMTAEADGQWASEPLISNEQYGIGGVHSVPGYYEGEVFGDTGWHLSLQQQTPQHFVGMIHGDQAFTLQGSLFMDLADAYLIDPTPGRPSSVRLWSTGFGVTASVGSHWQARFLFSLPLIGTSLTPRNQPRFNFGLTAQF